MKKLCGLENAITPVENYSALSLKWKLLWKRIVFIFYWKGSRFVFFNNTNKVLQPFFYISQVRLRVELICPLAEIMSGTIRFGDIPIRYSSTNFSMVQESKKTKETALIIPIKRRYFKIIMTMYKIKPVCMLKFTHFHFTKRMMKKKKCKSLEFAPYCMWPEYSALAGKEAVY